MVANIFRTLLLILFPAVVFGQSLDLSVSSQTANNNSSTFLLQNGEISINEDRLQFLNSGESVSGYEVLGVSPDYSKISLLKWAGDSEKGELVIFNSSGARLTAYSTIAVTDRASFAVFPFNNGELLLRDKITNFTFYDTFGEISQSISSSSQSKEGEVISEVAISPNGETVVIYNPKIKRDGQLGSKAQVMLPDGSFENIFFSNDRYLKTVIVSQDGNIIVAISAQSGADDQVLIMDRFGNELNSMFLDENLVGASLSDDLEYITLYSGGRVIVYSTMNGEKLGATSFRTSIFSADYFPEDNILLVLTGNYSEDTGVMNGAEFRAIDLEERKIASSDISGAIGFNKAITPRLVRLTENEYQLLGGTKRIRIKANF